MSNSVTQYIGARYVPKFFTNSDDTEEWRPGVEYEPLTIVTWNMNSYTSKKPVPSSVGSPSENPDYWVATGMYNAQIAAIQTQVNQHEIDLYKGVEFANVKGYGAVGDGATDDSAAFQAAADSGKIVFVPAGTYVVSDVSFSSSAHIIGSPNTVIRPKYIDGIAQNVFTVTGGKYAIFENILFSGTFYGATDETVYRQSTIEVSNCDSCMLSGVTFRRIDDSVTAIESKYRDRKGMSLTVWDVNNTVLDRVVFDGMGSEESVWIADHSTKTTDAINVDIVNCSCVNMNRLSVFNIIGNRVNMSGFIADESNNFQTYSFANLFCYYVNISDSTFDAHCGDFIDTYEGGSFRPVMVNIKNCSFSNCRGKAIYTCCDVLNVENCNFVCGHAVDTTATPASDQTLIVNAGYTAYINAKPMDIINFDKCRFDAVFPQGSWNVNAAMLSDGRSGANVYIRNCYCNLNGLKGGVAWFIASASATVENNVFESAGFSYQSGSYKSFFESTEGASALRFINNTYDDEYLFLILGAGVENLYIQNNVNDAGHQIGFCPQANKVHFVESDTSLINIYADNYTGTTGGYSSADWTASSASQTLEALTGNVKVFPGTYLFVCDVPDCSPEVMVTLKYANGAAFGEAVTISKRSTIAIMATLTGELDICLAMAQASATTFTNIGTRKLKAIKIG